MRKYVVYDDCPSSSVTDIFYFDTEEEAMNKAENLWVHKTKMEQKKSIAFWVGYCDDYNEAEGYSENGNFYPIKDFKKG